MDHDAHLADSVDQASPTARIVTFVLIAAVLFGGVAYVFFGPGL